MNPFYGKDPIVQSVEKILRENDYNQLTTSDYGPKSRQNGGAQGDDVMKKAEKSTIVVNPEVKVLPQAGETQIIPPIK